MHSICWWILSSESVNRFSPILPNHAVIFGDSWLLPARNPPPGWPSSHFRSPSQNRSGTVPPAKHWLGYDACSFDHPLCFFSNWHAELPENLERCANYPIVRVCQTEVLFLKKEIMLITANPLFSRMKIEHRTEEPTALSENGKSPQKTYGLNGFSSCSLSKSPSVGVMFQHPPLRSSNLWFFSSSSGSSACLAEREPKCQWFSGDFRRSSHHYPESQIVRYSSLSLPY